MKEARLFNNNESHSQIQHPSEHHSANPNSPMPKPYKITMSLSSDVSERSARISSIIDLRMEDEAWKCRGDVPAHRWQN
jgi:hypothetical protein